MSDPAPPPPQAQPLSRGRATRRQGALLAVASVTLLVGVAWGAWWLLVGRHRETTDNAYVQAPQVQLTPQAAGTVVAVLADDTERVQAGQLLVRLDASDAQQALAQAEAALAQTVREVRTLFAADATLAAAVRQREAELPRLQAELDRASDDLRRRRPLLASGAISGEELQHAEAAVLAARGAVEAARAALAVAREQAGANRALTDGLALERHPRVERAAAAVREADTALRRTELRAPVAGQVARRSVQVGQRVAPGAPLMTLIPLERAWVDANFKESQLRRLRVGQPVRLTSDLYGREVVFHGQVAGVGAGTGAAFALLPAQNATGNWIKVVQRLPVRVTLDPAELAAHPLRVGLSMEAVVDISQDAPSAPSPASAPAAPASAATAEDPFAAAAERRVRAIIAAHRGGRATP